MLNNVYIVIKEKRMYANRELLTTLSIQRINDALLVMKHFIDLSNKLLPILHVLQRKSQKSDEDYAKIDRIAAVYSNHTFDPITSDVLLNSPILSLIKQSFTKLCEKDADIEIREEAMIMLKNEYDRLKNNWNLASYN